MAKHKTHFEDCDVLVVGGGMAGTGATFEARHWGRDMKIICVEKANIDRSGAVAQGLYAINCYMGMQWGENQPEDHVRYARNDLMGMVREDLGYDMARHVDSTVHMFDEWGLPMMKNEKTGRYLREGKWQIMIHGESYKPIVAEAAKKSADNSGIYSPHGLVVIGEQKFFSVPFLNLIFHEIVPFSSSLRYRPVSSFFIIGRPHSSNI